jgi:hypothetical protein
MTKNDIGRALKTLAAELHEIVSSYFAPVRVAVNGVRWLIGLHDKTSSEIPSKLR